MIKVDFNRPITVGNEFEYMRQAIEHAHISGDGVFTKKCHTFLESELGVSKALLSTSCTHALEMSAILLDIKPGDEVIIPDFTFVSTVNAFVLRGAKPVFVDVRPDTLNLDESKLEAAAGSLAGCNFFDRPSTPATGEGVSEAVVQQVDVQLEAHELVKVRVGDNAPEDRHATAAELALRTRADLTQVLGRTALLYRPRAKEPTIVLP
jgi:putative YhbY family RNA-binding protein